jgi:serine/threonine-protein kinase
VVADAKLRRRLRGDLDTIVLKALKRAPAERYGTVEALADDIERHLNQRPVRAQPDSAGYRLRKFLLRNRVAVTASAVALCAVLIGAALAAWQASVAIAESRRADEVRRLIESIFVDADPRRDSGRPLTAVELLRQANARMATLRISSADVRAELLNTLATSMMNLQDNAGAAMVLKAAQQDAEALGPDHRQALRTRRLLAQLQVANGNPQEGLRLVEPVIAALRALSPRSPEELLAALLARTEALNAALDWPAAERSAEEVLREADVAGGDRDIERISALMQLSLSHDRRNQPEPALDAARRAHELALAVHRGRGSHPVVNDARMLYAKALWDVDQQDPAIDLMRESWRESQRVFGADSRIAGEHAQTMTVYLASTGYLKEALAAADDALRILGPTVQPDSVAYAGLLEARAAALLGVNQPEPALAAVERAREIVVAKLGATHEQAHVLQVYRARALMLLGRLDEAADMLRATIAQYRATGYSTVAAPTYLLGVVARLQGDTAAALKLQESAYRAVRKGPTARRWGSRVLVEIGLNQLALNQREPARAALTEALTILQEKFRMQTPLIASAHLGLAQLALSEGAASRALGHCEQADAFWRDLAPDSRGAGEAAFWLGQCYRALGRTAEARSAHERARALLGRSPFHIDGQLLQAASGR